MTITVENNNHTLSEGLCTACSAIIDILGDVNHDGFVTILDLATLNELFYLRAHVQRMMLYVI